MRTLKEVTPIIKGAIWDLKESSTTITVKSVYDLISTEIDFNTELTLIMQYLESVKDNFLWTRKDGFLALTPFDKGKISDLVSKI